MTLAGILAGRVAQDASWPVLGVVVGAAPRRRLDAWAPFWQQAPVQLVPSAVPYDRPAPDTWLGQLDPFYEAKCLPYLQGGDLLWLVGHRATSDADWANKGRQV
jgi:hypothetical protein